MCRLCSICKNMELVVTRYVSLTLNPNIYYDRVADSCGKKQGYSLHWCGLAKRYLGVVIHDLGSIIIVGMVFIKSKWDD